MVKFGITTILFFAIVVVSVLSLGSATSEAAVPKNAFIDDGYGTGLSADGLFFAEGDPSAYQVRNGGHNNCHLT